MGMSAFPVGPGPRRRPAGGDSRRSLRRLEHALDGPFGVGGRGSGLGRGGDDDGVHQAAPEVEDVGGHVRRLAAERNDCALMHERSPSPRRGKATRSE